ncbi:MAG: hypothetical protein A2007_02315 [Verrucomicrobia bacterium GWC2_42_7]|nr:MAG: hypothetical protein A2007_02315 [Verrucomicrobia bacterium GWC2_42_7]
MELIAHRGYWKVDSEKNTLEAFRKAIDCNYGIEVDIRDHCGEIVISHDLPDANSPKLADLLCYYQEQKSDKLIAFNVKSCGLAKKLGELIRVFRIKNYFTFDMAIPDILDYYKRSLSAYVRISEFEELNAALLDKATGVWVDGFFSTVTSYDFLKEIASQKSLCFVSAELHNRESIKEWENIKQFCHHFNTNQFSICTDLPDEAEKFFNKML